MELQTHVACQHTLSELIQLHLHESSKFTDVHQTAIPSAFSTSTITGDHLQPHPIETLSNSALATLLCIRSLVQAAVHSKRVHFGSGLQMRP